MFRSQNWQSSANSQPVFSTVLSRPLLHVLDHNQSPSDFICNELKGHVEIALKGQTDVAISRAESDLRKAMQSLAFLSNAVTSSLPTLTALALPGTTIALFWSIHALLQNKYQKPKLDNLIHHRNHDARLLFQQLAQLNLVPWYTQSVDKIPANIRPADIQFSPGHPVPGAIYRQHPLKSKHHYYPVTHYFSLLFEEREQALLSLLGDLGTTKITITPISSEISSSTTNDRRQKIFEYPDQVQREVRSIEPQAHPWLAYEPSWQTIINERLSRGVSSIQFEFDMDVMGMLKAQLQTITQLVPELDSLLLPTNYEEAILMQVLQPQKIQAEFSRL